MESPGSADALASYAKDEIAVRGYKINGLILSLGLLGTGSGWLRDLFLRNRVGLHCPCSTVIVIAV